MQTTSVKSTAAPLTPFSLWLLGWLCLLLPTLALTAALPTVSRVKDINTAPGSSDPQNIVKVGNLTFFTAYTPTTGRELWKSDGTAAGTVLVKDINLGNSSAFQDCGYSYCDPNFTVVGNVLYFIANNGVTGKELWKSDGTAAGTVLVKDIKAGSGSAFCVYSDCDSNFTAVGSVLYFVADNGVNGYELWKSDGTAAGTVLVKDIYAGSGSSLDEYSDLTAMGNVLYFVANNGVNGWELWKSDGTAAGTVLVKDINAGSSSALGNYPNLTAVGNVLYFAADNGVTGEELWKSNGTATGTLLVKDIYPGSGSAWGDYDYPNFTAVGTVLYFQANNGIHGSELWRSDGTATGTVLVKDINIGTGSPFCSNQAYGYTCYDPNFTAVGTVLYFNVGSELWRSDGTVEGTILVKRIGYSAYSEYYFTAVGNVLYFVANDYIQGSELWKSDGTAAGTVLVKDIYAGRGDAWNYNDDPHLTVVGTMLYFRANNGVHGSELWRSDGTAAGTLLVKDVYPGSGSPFCYGYSCYDPNFTAVGNVLYFVADNGVTGRELWKSDGTAAGTVLVKDIYPGGSSSSPYNLTTVGNVLYFVADDGINGYELWKSNGTAAGTLLVKEVYPGSGSAFCYGYSCSDPNFTAVGNVLYFVADNGVTGRELWKSDGTAAGTVLVKDINAGTDSPFCKYDNNYYNYYRCYDTYFTAVGSVLYFRADNGVTGYELWKSDGTAAGTVLLKDINPGSSGAWNYYDDPNFTTLGNVLYFIADDGINGEELWKSDGTATGTVLVKDIYPGNYGSVGNLTTVGTVLYFRAYDGVNGSDELWRSNGTAAGTVLVKDINPGNGGSYPYYFTAVGNMLYFQANNGVTGSELWKSNGAAAGTVLVKDIKSGSDSSNSDNLTAVGNMLYFQANNGVNGNELWQTDGTTAGTQMKELVPGGGGSDPDYLTALGTKLYFTAVDNATGRELWRADIPNLWTVTPSANIGGVVSTNVPQAVAPNSTLKFTVTPLPYYNRNLVVGGTCPKGSWSGNVWTTGAITANCTVVFGFISTLPDFVVTAITLPTTPIVNNGTFTATITVKNQGPVVGDGKNLDVWHHQPVNQTCGAIGTKRVAVGILTAGQSKAFAVSLPSGIAAAKTLRAFVDSGCGTAESNEGNNQLTKAYTVQ